MEERKYLVYGTPKGDRCVDEFVEFFDTAEEANEAADSIWYHLTKNEKKKTRVYSCYVTKADLLDDAIDEDGVIDWNANAGGRDYDGCFDSEKIEEEE